MKTFLIIITLLLSGCGTYGEPLWLASYADANDKCQSQNWKNGVQPRYCGGSGNRTYIYATPNQSPVGAQVGYTKK